MCALKICGFYCGVGNNNGNRAFTDRTCRMPVERPLPAVPNTKCSSYDQCLEEGGAICYSKFIGLEGCALALKELRVAGVLSNPGCAAAAAKLAGEKYGMDEALVDFLHGVADDMGGSLLQSDSLLDNIIGGGILLLNYGVKIEKARVCTNDFVQVHYGPKMRWNSLANSIREEPLRTLNQCNSSVNRHNTIFEQLDEIRSKTRTLSTHLADIQAIHGSLGRKEVEASDCNSSAEESFGSETRYLIGVEFSTQTSEDFSGVEIIGFADGMPAKDSGLRIGDTIVSLNDNVIRNGSDLIGHVQDHGDNKIIIGYVRRGVKRVATLVPFEREVMLRDL